MDEVTQVCLQCRHITYSYLLNVWGEFYHFCQAVCMEDVCSDILTLLNVKLHASLLKITAYFNYYLYLLVAILNAGTIKN